MKKEWALLLLALSVVSACAYPAMLYASVNTSGMAGGGLRWEVNEEVCVNGTLGVMTQENVGRTYLYANALFLEKRLGPALSLIIPNAEHAENTLKLSAVFAAEKKLNDRISVGILPALFSIVHQDDTYFELLADWSVYILVD